MSKDVLYLQHILECIDRVQSKTTSLQDEEFFRNQDAIDIVLRNLQIMAESTQRLTKGAKLLAPEVPWQEISDFRNILVHDYLGNIDYKLVWQIIKKELPELEKSITKILAEQQE